MPLLLPLMRSVPPLATVTSLTIRPVLAISTVPLLTVVVPVYVFTAASVVVPDWLNTSDSGAPVPSARTSLSATPPVPVPLIASVGAAPLDGAMPAPIVSDWLLLLLAQLWLPPSAIEPAPLIVPAEFDVPASVTPPLPTL